MKSRLPVLVGAAAVLLAGCATAPESSQVKASLPTLAPDHGRIYFYRSSISGTAVLPPVKLNGQVVGIAKPHSFFFVDRLPGDYKVQLRGAGLQQCRLTLEKGQSRYVRVDFPRESLTYEFAVVPLEIVLASAGLICIGDGGYIYPELVEDSIGEKEIVRCRYAGSYWGSIGYGGEIREAAANGDLEKVKAQVKGNPDLVLLKDTYGCTPLFYAVSSGYMDIAEWLLEHGADVNAVNYIGETPLRVAAAARRGDVVELLRKHGANDGSNVSQVAGEPFKQHSLKQELDGIQGTWKLVALEANGQPAPAEFVAVLKLIFKGDTLTFTPGEPGFTNYKFKLDPTTKPASFTMAHADGTKEGKTNSGIYSLDGDCLQICFGRANQVPTDFTAKAGSRQFMYSLEREK